MLKTRKRSISLIVTLAFLLTFIIPVGSAFAAVEYAKISGSYTYVDADDNQPAGVIDVVYGDDYVSAGISGIYAEITLPEGAEFTSVSSVCYGVYNDTTGWNYNGWTLEGKSDTSITLSNTAFNALTVDNIYLDIDSDVTGDIDAEVVVWAAKGTSVAWEASDNVTIAKVASGDVSVSAASAKTLAVGSNKPGAKITITELSPGALTAGPATNSDNDIFLTIQSSNVKWDTSNETEVSTVGVEVYSIDDDNYTNSDKVLRLDVKKASTVIKGKIEITPKFVVQPGASGDVVVKVSGDDIDTAEFTVGKIGEGTVAVDVEKADKDNVYLGQSATFDNVVVTLDPSIELSDGEYITITLPEGFKWVNDDEVIVCDVSSDNVKFNSLYNSDRSIWLDVSNDESNDVELSDFQILADYNAPVGDVEITFGGAVEGTYKIGTAKAAFEVKADVVDLTQRGSDLVGGKIVITEVADGALVTTDGNAAKEDGVPGYFDIVLPMGVTFAKTPDVDVEDGDLAIDNVKLNDDQDALQFDITEKSNSASTIEITDVYFNIDNRAALGDVVAKVGKEYNLISDNYLATVKVGQIVSETAAEATMKIGDTKMVVNGKEITMDVAPYIKDGRTMLPVRFAANAVGVSNDNILWDGANKKVTIIKGDRVVQFTIGSNVMTVNGAAITMDVAPEITNGRTMLPVRYVGYALGASISWDGDTQSVAIQVD